MSLWRADFDIIINVFTANLSALRQGTSVLVEICSPFLGSLLSFPARVRQIAAYLYEEFMCVGFDSTKNDSIVFSQMYSSI
jgi:hypothetical protein